MSRLLSSGLVAFLLLLLAAPGWAVDLSPEIAKKLNSVLRLHLIADATDEAVKESPLLSSREGDDGVLRVGVTMLVDGVPAGLDEIPGVRIGVKGERVWTAWLPIEQVTALAARPEVLRVSSSKHSYPLLDESIPMSDVDAAWSSGYTGVGVIVGVIDTGIDWEHGDFLLPNGDTRIKYLYDIAGGGTEYTEADINDALDGMGTINQHDYDGHGTHVTATAAGNGGESGGVYTGVAKEANIIFYKAFNDGTGSFADGDIIAGMNYIKTKANELGMPAVINMSLGNHSGPHDGTSNLEIALDGVGGPGVIPVVAAGNSGEDPIHFSGSGSFSRRINVTVSRDTGLDTFVVFEIWYEGSDDVVITVEGPTGDEHTFPPTQGVQYLDDGTGDGSVWIDNAYEGIDGENGDKRIFVLLGDYSILDNPVAPGTWTFSFTDATSGAVHGWAVGGSNASSMIIDTDYTHLIAQPSTAEDAVAVGAYVSRICWPNSGGQLCVGDWWLGSWSAVQVGEAAPFTSPGPTRDGRHKPEVSAPGFEIMAALSQDASNYSQLVAPDGKHHILQGTSMAAPHVAGVVALLLETAPNATPENIQNYLAWSARPWGVSRPVMTDVYSYDFESGLSGWLALDEGDQGNTWTIGTYRSHSPDNSAYCLQSGSGANQIETMISPPISLPASGTITLDYWHGFESPNMADSPHTVGIRQAGGGAFTTVRTYLAAEIGNYPTVPDDWVHETGIDLSAYTGQTVELGWVYQGTDADSWFFDDVRITASESSLGNWNPWFGHGLLDADGALDATPVDLESFTGRVQPDGSVLIRWRVTDSANTIGFVVSRATAAEGPYQALHNDHLTIEESQFIDRTARSGRTYFYWLEEILQSGSKMYGPIVVEMDGALAGGRANITWNSPNPFSPGTTISFVLDAEAHVQLEVFDLSGRVVRTLVSELRQVGMNNVTWDGRDDMGRQLASGNYFYRLTTPESQITRRMTLLK